MCHYFEWSKITKPEFKPSPLLPNTEWSRQFKSFFSPIPDLAGLLVSMKTSANLSVEGLLALCLLVWWQWQNFMCRGGLATLTLGIWGAGVDFLSFALQSRPSIVSTSFLDMKIYGPLFTFWFKLPLKFHKEEHCRDEQGLSLCSGCCGRQDLLGFSSS